MHSRTSSEISAYSSLEFSYSEMDSVGLQIDIPSLDISTLGQRPPPGPLMCADPTLAEVQVEPQTGLIPHVQDVAHDEPQHASKPTIRKDPLFYCETVVFKVEDTLFCVPKSGLIESGTYFGNLLNETAPDSIPTAPPGSSDDNPIVLQGVLKDHFQHLLRLIYPFRGIKGPENDDQWLAILHLATEWNFSDIRETALHHLEHLFRSPSPTSPTHDPIHALQLCLKYNITQHLIHQYELLITSIAPLKRDTLLTAGLDDDTIQLIRDMREEWLCGIAWRHYSPISLVDNGRELIPRRMSARFIVGRYVNEVLASPWSDAREDSCLTEEAKRLEAELISLQAKEWAMEAEVKGVMLLKNREGGLKEGEGLLKGGGTFEGPEERGLEPDGMFETAGGSVFGGVAEAPAFEDAGGLMLEGEGLEGLLDSETELIEEKTKRKQSRDEGIFAKVAQRRIERANQQRTERLRKRQIAKEKMEEIARQEKKRQEEAKEKRRLEKERKKEARWAEKEVRKNTAPWGYFGSG